MSEPPRLRVVAVRAPPDWEAVTDWEPAWAALPEPPTRKPKEAPAVRFTTPPVTAKVWLAVASWKRSVAVEVNEPPSMRRLEAGLEDVKVKSPLRRVTLKPALLLPKVRAADGAASAMKVAPLDPATLVRVLTEAAGRLVELRVKVPAA